ncbi:MAG: FAD:protein FMN transferase [Candidatus Margulisbacteria bacterium]|nr:FAD:protein FMN transferase [Candidatus Margulisiibacteriota bacterium]
MKKLIYLILVVLIFVLFYFSFFRARSADKEIVAMDTIIRVKVEGEYAGQYASMAIEEIKRLEKLFNRFDPSSEVSRINRGEKVVMSEDMRRILVLSEKMRQLTKGAFNVRYSGKIDLGGIAKGYAVESARGRLVKKGAKSGIIDAHSSIAVFGPRTWKVGIQDPNDKNKLLAVVELCNGQAVSTSGNYERGRHIIDPRTRKPAKGCQSVTLIGQDAGELDALSTAMFVLGSTEGRKLISKMRGVKAIIK